MKITLAVPIVRVVKDGPDQTITELTLRDTMVAGDMRGIRIGSEGMLVDDLLKIAGRLCAQPEDVMNKLSIPDMNTLMGIVGNFMTGAGGAAGSAQPA